MTLGFGTSVLGSTGDEIGNLFSSMQWFVIVPLCIGLLLLIAECFIPGFGVCGILGLVCVAGGIIANAIVTKSIVQTLFLVLIFLVLIFVIFLILVRSARFGVISKSPLVQQKTAVPSDFIEKNEERLNALIGKIGTATTPFIPCGKFSLDDVIYDGITRGEALDKGDRIKVVEIEGDKIIVEKVEVENEN